MLMEEPLIVLMKIEHICLYRIEKIIFMQLESEHLELRFINQ